MTDSIGYFVPGMYAQALRDAGLTLVPGTTKNIEGDHGHFVIDGFLIRGRSRKLESILKELGLEKRGLGFFNWTSRCCYIYGPDPVVAIQWNYLLAHDPVQHHALREAIERSIEQLSSLTGKRVALHMPEDRIFAPFRHTEKAVNIVLGAFPPGKSETSTIATLAMRTESQYFIRDRPTIGYGTVVRNADGIAIGQIVHDTLYLFLSLNEGTLKHFPDAALRVYRDMIATCWKAYLERGEEKADEPVTDPALLVEATASWTDVGEKELDGMIKDHEEKVREAEKAYHTALAELKMWQITKIGARRYIENNIAAHSHPEWIASWQTVLDHPLTDSIIVKDLGLHLTTKPVVLEHEGVRYPLGSFTMRADGAGMISIWCNDSRHPERVPHPHISAFGSVCYGNLSLLVQEEIFMRRNYPQALRYLLDWIQEGYDPNTTTTPLTEWPPEVA
ncbi:MAG: hypothetical protein V4682_01945 [Patescibacteria group bacterium]